MTIRRRRAILIAVAAGLLAFIPILGRASSPPHRAVATSAYQAELARLDAQFKHLEGRLARRPGDWLDWAALAGSHLERVRLTGDWTDYEAADEAIRQAFAAAPPGAGPFLERAELNQTLHRFADVGADLDRAARRLLLQDHERAAITLLRADNDRALGRDSEAERGYREALRLRREPTALAAYALFLADRGDTRRALPLLSEAEKAYHGITAEPRAWLAIQRGDLLAAGGELSEAVTEYRRAAKPLPGWWQVDRARGEALRRAGRLVEARHALTAALTANPDPSLMDRLAELERRAGREAGAAAWLRRAGPLHEARYVRFPEAARGALADHLVLAGRDLELARSLAAQDVAAAPSREARQRLERVARAIGP